MSIHVVALSHIVIARWLVMWCLYLMTSSSSSSSLFVKECTSVHHAVLDSVWQN